MKRLMLRLAGGYAGAGALAYLVYRTVHLRSSAIRHWADLHGREAADQLAEVQRGLEDLRSALREQSASPVDELSQRRAVNGPRNQTRRPITGTPEDQPRAA